MDGDGHGSIGSFARHLTERNSRAAIRCRGPSCVRERREVDPRQRRVANHVGHRTRLKIISVSNAFRFPARLAQEFFEAVAVREVAISECSVRSGNRGSGLDLVVDKHPVAFYSLPEGLNLQSRRERSVDRQEKKRESIGLGESVCCVTFDVHANSIEWVFEFAEEVEMRLSNPMIQVDFASLCEGHILFATKPPAALRRRCRSIAFLSVHPSRCAAVHPPVESYRSRRRSGAIGW